MMKAHSWLLKLGLDINVATATRLLQAYAGRSLASARQIFDQIPSSYRDAFLWGAMISAYSRSSHPVAALHLFSDLLCLQTLPSPLSYAFASAARSIAASGDPLLARALHAQIIRRQITPNLVVSTSTIDMYSKCGSLDLARKVFDEMPLRNAITWNAMLAAYSSSGMAVPTFELFRFVRCEAVADEFAVASGLSACAELMDLRSGKQIHAYSVASGFEIDPVVANATAKMYLRCDQFGSAETALKGRESDALSQILMIRGYVFLGKYADAARIISRSDGFAKLFMADHSISVSFLTIAANLGLLRLGKKVHGFSLSFGFFTNSGSNVKDQTAFATALIGMYSKCSSLDQAWLVFNDLKEPRDVPHWNAMMSGCICHGMVSEARELFDEMPFKNVISWTSMISAYAQQGPPQKGLEIFADMYGREGLVRGNSFTFSAALSACSNLAALDAGKQTHAQVLKTQDGDDVIVETALIDMYSRSGSLSYARRIFDRLRNANVLSWTAMITAYAAHGFASEAVEVFESMTSSGFVPSEVTFVSVLSACSHGGLIEKGLQCFALMRTKYGIAPRADHYTCLVDLLGRAGKLDEAQMVLESRRHEDAAAWGALLGGCKMHGNVEMGSEVAKEMIDRGHQTSDAFVVLSNLYAFSGNWDALHGLREDWKRRRPSGRKQGHSIV